MENVDQNAVAEKLAKGSVIVKAQYIKDFSFENPQVPNSLLNIEEHKIRWNVDVDVSKISGEDDMYEVVLSFIIESFVEKDESKNESKKKDDDSKESEENSDSTVFFLDLQYAGLFAIEEQKEDLGKILNVHCPGLLFPFVRRLMADITREGGFPALAFSGIDFMNLYSMKLAQKDSK